jgi:radical SAM-linked protein
MRSQRLRVTFAKGPQLRFITHLDLMRFWERALRRAGIQIAYSEGFSPHPQLSLAAPLPVGVCGTAELMDVFLAVPVSAQGFCRLMSPQLPPGLTLVGVRTVPLSLPSMQSLLQAAEYRAELPSDSDLGELRGRVQSILTSQSLPWQHKREHQTRNYDLRAQIYALSLRTGPGAPQLVMKLQADNAASGRPDQVLLALGLPQTLPLARTHLELRSSGGGRRKRDAADTARLQAELV